MVFTKSQASIRDYGEVTVTVEYLVREAPEALTHRIRRSVKTGCLAQLLQRFSLYRRSARACLYVDKRVSFGGVATYVLYLR